MKVEKTHGRLPVLQDRVRRDPSAKVYEDDVCYAFDDIEPEAPVHSLIVPKTHYDNLAAGLERRPVTSEVASSSLVHPAIFQSTHHSGC